MLLILNGKLCVWLFLLIEIMFFVVLIGIYIVICFGVLNGIWLFFYDVYFKEWIGVFNMFVLICLSVFVVFVFELVKGD